MNFFDYDACMFSPSNCSVVDRRSWLKALTLGGAASVFSSCAEKKPAAQATPNNKVRGVIFMVSDGMSPGVLTMAQAFSQQIRNSGTTWWKLLNERSAARGLMDTQSANSMVTDSAAASSAWGSGHRVNNGMINVTPDGKELEPIAAVLGKKGVRCGLVTTAKITHATPAGFATSVRDRDDEESIAQQYLNRVEILLGGGMEYFDPASRTDGKDLFSAYRTAGYEVIRNREQLLAVKGKKLLGTFHPGHFPYNIDREQDPDLMRDVPTLEEMSRAAVSRFLEGNQNFLLQIEGARIDHAAHMNDIGALLREQLAFDDALAAVWEMTAGHDDILIVVTSDHGNANPGLNGLGSTYSESTKAFQHISGMKASHEKIFHDWESHPDTDLGKMIQQRLAITLQTDERDALQNILTNGKVNEWNDLLAKPEGLLGQFVGNHTGIGWTGTSHTSDPTLVSAIGPQSERFSGMVINSDVFGHLVELLG